VEGSPVTGTASVHVTQDQLFRIDVTPSNVNLRIGDQQQFNATGYDADGNEVPITPAWTTTGGTITPSGGLYTATTVGDFNVTASVEGSPVTGTASVHVTQDQCELLAWLWPVLGLLAAAGAGYGIYRANKSR
ncbi:MAG: hypothetical protein ACUVQG_14980, partial [Thermogutta sp.]